MYKANSRSRRDSHSAQQPRRSAARRVPRAHCFVVLVPWSRVLNSPLLLIAPIELPGDAAISAIRSAEEKNRRERSLEALAMQLAGYGAEALAPAPACQPRPTPPLRRCTHLRFTSRSWFIFSLIRSVPR